MTGTFIDGIVSHEAACSDCKSARNFHRKLTNSGTVEEDRAVLFVFNDRQPCKSYLVVERFPEPEPECLESPIGLHFFEFAKFSRIGLRPATIRKCINCNERRLFVGGEEVLSVRPR